MNRLLIILLLAVTLTATGFAAPAVSSGDAALDHAVAQANQEWLTAMRMGDVATIVKPYEEDAVFVGLDGTATRGRTAIAALMKARFSRNGLAVSTSIEPHHLVRDGEVAVELGVAEVVWKPAGGKAVGGKGRYLSVWRRQQDGGWKIHRNVILP